jgi:hypothetical protein
MNNSSGQTLKKSMAASLQILLQLITLAEAEHTTSLDDWCNLRQI